MGWWASADGTGLIGDRPADLLGSVLHQSLGDPTPVDLFQGFLVALVGAVLRNPTELISATPPPNTVIVAYVGTGTPIVIPFEAPSSTSSLDDAVFAAVEAVAFQYRETTMSRPPTLAELVETVAFVASGHLIDGTGTHVPLYRLEAIRDP